MMYLLKCQPSNSIYHTLLDFLGIISKEFILVKRKYTTFGKETNFLLKELSPFLLKKELSNEWPGTKVFSQDELVGEIFYFEVSPESIKILKKYSKSLFDWLSPNLPEDLAFFRKDGSLIFGSIIHENDYWLDLTKEESNLAAQKFPDLKSALKRIK